MAHLHSSEQRIDISLIDWQYQCIKLQKPQLSRTQYEKKKKVEVLRENFRKGIQQKVDLELERRRNMSPCEKLKMSLNMEHSKTCQIF